MPTPSTKPNRVCVAKRASGPRSLRPCAQQKRRRDDRAGRAAAAGRRRSRNCLVGARYRSRSARTTSPRSVTAYRQAHRKPDDDVRSGSHRRTASGHTKLHARSIYLLELPSSNMGRRRPTVAASFASKGQSASAGHQHMTRNDCRGSTRPRRGCGGRPWPATGCGTPGKRQNGRVSERAAAKRPGRMSQAEREERSRQRRAEVLRVPMAPLRPHGYLDRPGYYPREPLAIGVGSTVSSSTPG